MKIDDIKKLIEIDKKIDHTQLDTESLKIPEQAVKYQQLAYDEALRLRFIEKEYNVAKYNRWMYYTGKADPEVYNNEPFDHKVLKSDLNLFLESDLILNEVQDRMIAQAEKLKLIVDAGKVMQNKSFNIKNALEHQKFMGGAF
jgi:hypothetical protein|tara:strand:+ start:6749 stop:7177 length:429 start_codon:yes stop_codon:yes gene_type:complete